MTVIWIFSCLIWSRISCFQRQCSFKSKSTWWFSHFSCRYDVGFLLPYPKAFESFLSHLVYYTKSIFLWDTFSFLLFCDLPFKYQTRVIETASRIFKYIISGCHRLNALLYHVEYGSQSPRSIKNSQLYLHCPSGHLDNFCDFSIRNYYDSFWYWRFSHY